MFGKRRETKAVKIGDVGVGGDHPIAVQSMTTTRTENVDETVEQIRQLDEAGCELARVAVPHNRAVESLGEIRERIDLPLIADIHFNPRIAKYALEFPIDKIRINPGNIGGREDMEEVVARTKEKGIPMRIGVNSGSVEEEMIEKYGYPSAEAMVESAMKHVRICEEMGYTDLVVSLKSTDVETCIRANRMFAEKTEYPLHIGVTEAGSKGYGSVKSAVGLGQLLLEGIGDTIRVSLSEDPVEEIETCYRILKATERRITEPEVVACPTCGRINIDLESLVEEVEERIREENMSDPIRISVLGCAVNGPGEAREADIGVAGAGGRGYIYRDGEEVRKVKEEHLVDALMEEVEKLRRKREKEVVQA